jgi:hypothetical protein
VHSASRIGSTSSSERGLQAMKMARVDIWRCLVVEMTNDARPKRKAASEHSPQLAKRFYRRQVPAMSSASFLVYSSNIVFSL